MLCSLMTACIIYLQLVIWSQGQTWHITVCFGSRSYALPHYYSLNYLHIPRACHSVPNQLLIDRVATNHMFIEHFKYRQTPYRPHRVFLRNKNFLGTFCELLIKKLQFLKLLIYSLEIKRYLFLITYISFMTI